MENTLTVEDFLYMEGVTQREPEWFDYRQGRITGSHMHSVKSCKINSDKQPVVVKQILDVGKFFSSKDLECGIAKEPVAREIYTEIMGKNHTKLCVDTRFNGVTIRPRKTVKTKRAAGNFITYALNELQ